MVCTIADNQPLQRLQRDVGIPGCCHGWREHCVHGFTANAGNVVLGLPGTALGYCQALFGYAGSPAAHTAKVARLLGETGAPWSRSHEMFWGFRRPEETPSGYVNSGTEPLLGSGRVPIVISGLDPAKDLAAIKAILATRPALPPAESILLRVVLNSSSSMKVAAGLLKQLVGEAFQRGEMPPWWLLLQSNLPAAEWETCQHLMGSDWAYANVAVNPFMPADAWDFVADQVTVGQLPLGTAGGVAADGSITLSPDAPILGAKPGQSYDLPEFTARLGQLRSSPTLIVLGPALPQWTDRDNQDRIERFLPHLQRSCDQLWAGVSESRRQEIWKMQA